MIFVEIHHLVRLGAATVFLAGLLAAGGCAPQYHLYEGCVVPCGYTAEPPLPFENYGPLPCPDPSARYCFPVDPAPQLHAPARSGPFPGQRPKSSPEKPKKPQGA